MKNIIPNLTGYAALYYHADGDPIPEDKTEFSHPKSTTREIIGFDEHGNPLVMGNGKLVPASKAKFLYWSQFAGLEMKEGRGFEDVLYRVIDDNLENRLSYSLTDLIVEAVKEAVVEHLASKTKTAEIE